MADIKVNKLKSDVDGIYIKMVADLLDEDENVAPSLTKEDVENCDRVVEVLGLDKERSKYFQRSRQNNQVDHEDHL